MQAEEYQVLLIDPSSTSTKIGVFKGDTIIMESTIRHTTHEIAQFPSILMDCFEGGNLIESRV